MRASSRQLRERVRVCPFARLVGLSTLCAYHSSLRFLHSVCDSLSANTCPYDAVRNALNDAFMLLAAVTNPYFRVQKLRLGEHDGSLASTDHLGSRAECSQTAHSRILYAVAMSNRSKSLFKGPNVKHFALVHRSVRDPAANDPESSDGVLKEVSKNKGKVGIALICQAAPGPVRPPLTLLLLFPLPSFRSLVTGSHKARPRVHPRARRPDWDPAQ